MKKFFVDYLEEFIFLLGLIFISVSAYFITISLGLLITGITLLVLERKIVTIKKSLARSR